MGGNPLKYRTIVADPPWHYGKTQPGFSGSENLQGRKVGNVRADVPYQTLGVDEIKALPVRDLSDAKGAHLYLWTTNTHLRHCWSVCEAWGFRYSTLLVWCKKPMGAAGFPAFPCMTEFVVFARRGTLPYKERAIANWWEWPRGVHSRKPEAFLDLVEAVSPGPYLELFSRRARLGWDYRWHDGDPVSVVSQGHADE